MPVPTVDNNFFRVFKRDGGLFAKAVVVFARRGEIVAAGDDFFAFGENLCRIFAHIELARGERHNALAEKLISALAAAAKHHAVSIIQTYD